MPQNDPSSRDPNPVNDDRVGDQPLDVAAALGFHSDMGRSEAVLSTVEECRCFVKGISGGKVKCEWVFILKRHNDTKVGWNNK
jgi:hypothetical protein